MKVTVVYGSRYGNTARITQAIAAKLEASGSVRQVEAPDPTAFDLEGVDLPVVGGPTEGHGVSESLRARLHQLPVGALQGRTAGAFDTRLNWPELLSGSAAPESPGLFSSGAPGSPSSGELPDPWPERTELSPGRDRTGKCLGRATGKRPLGRTASGTSLTGRITGRRTGPGPLDRPVPRLGGQGRGHRT